jgi:hypothetical protein
MSRGIGSLQRQILATLHERPEQAATVSELAMLIYGPTPSRAQFVSLRRAVKSLSRSDWVDSYYVTHGPFPRTGHQELAVRRNHSLPWPYGWHGSIRYPQSHLEQAILGIAQAVTSEDTNIADRMDREVGRWIETQRRSRARTTVWKPGEIPYKWLQQRIAFEPDTFYGEPHRFGRGGAQFRRAFRRAVQHLIREGRLNPIFRGSDGRHTATPTGGRLIGVTVADND